MRRPPSRPGRALATASVCIILPAVLLLDGCTLWKLRKNVEQLEQMATIGGHVSRARDDDAPIVVVLYTYPPAAVVDSFILERSGSYFFVVPAGTYRIAAFVDRSRSFAYQAGQDPAAYYGAPTEVRVAPGQTIGGLDIRIEAEPSIQLDFAISVRPNGQRVTRELPPVHLGEIVTFDDPRFSADNGDLGLWQPVEFLFKVGAGFYFLEAFDPKKTPVLFVHGAGGTPADWRFLAERIDRTKFQPWLLYYPSGLDLDVVARGVARWMNTLAFQYGFRRIVVVAHSMGGLVSRAAINRMVTNGDGGVLALFVSISSPWNGNSGAKLGAEHSPVVMPMWVDMAPGSAFLGDLFRTPLPPQCQYNLLFSYGGHSLVLRVPNDGVVALSSELALPAQQAARKVYGFNESHGSILDSAEVSQTLNTLLAGAAP